DINNNSGSTAAPSGLARIAARSTTASTNNTVEEVYGGDLDGNLLRFDVNGTIADPGIEGQLLVSLKDSSGNAQPITAKPTVSSVPGSNVPLVIVGTGRYLGASDLTDLSKFSVYAVKDELKNATLQSPRVSGSQFVNQTIVEDVCPKDAPSTTCTQGQVVRMSASTPVDW